MDNFKYLGTIIEKNAKMDKDMYTIGIREMTTDRKTWKDVN